jgi:protein-tyrosine phosphatase
VTFVQVEDLSVSNVTACFGPCFGAIRDALEAEQKVMVHCHAGKSRSPAIVIAFLMQHFHVSLQLSYRHVEKARNGLMMNPTFKRQLSDYEYSLFGKRSMRFCVFCGDFDCSCLQFNIL